MADADDIKPRPRRGPAWVYVLGGIIALPFLMGFVLALFHMRTADTGVEPTTLGIVGAALGYLVYRIFSKPLPRRPSDL